MGEILGSLGCSIPVRGENAMAIDRVSQMEVDEETGAAGMVLN
jgi:hypothetical protein